MRRTSATLVLTLCLWLASCTHTQTPETGTQPRVPPTSFSDNGIAAQSRITQSFRDSVITPAMRACWARLQGEGAVAMDFSYKKSGRSWVLDTVRVTKSTLPKAQEDAALKCMQASARDSSFAVDRRENLERAAKEFVVRLSVSVPLPAAGSDITTAQMARINGTGGLGDVPGCSACVSRKEYPYGLKCEAKTSGGNLDCREHSSNVCSVSPTACLRGFFAGQSGVIMY